MRADHYDTFAESYARENETGLFNAHYERPAMIDLAGDVTGRSILDAGCGAGPLAAALRDRGAQITGFDSSPAMVALAQRRLGTDAKVLVADLAEPLPFGTGEFDDVVASPAVARDDRRVHVQVSGSRSSASRRSRPRRRANSCRPTWVSARRSFASSSSSSKPAESAGRDRGTEQVQH